MFIFRKYQSNTYLVGSKVLPHGIEDSEEEVILPPGTRITIKNQCQTVLQGEKITFYSADADIPEFVSTMAELEAVTGELKGEYCEECGGYNVDGLESDCSCS